MPKAAQGIRRHIACLYGALPLGSEATKFRLCHHMFLLHERFFHHVNILRGFWPARGHFGHPHMDFWTISELQTSKFLSQPLAGLGDDSW